MKTSSLELLLRTNFSVAALTIVGVLGVGLGVITGLVGVGGGFLIVPALVLVGGLAMRAAAQDLEIAEAQGIGALFMYKLAFLIAIAMAAMAGALYGQIYALSPFMGERPLMMAFIVVVLGGMGSIPGAALGGLILGFGESFLGTFYGASVSTFVSFGVVILLLIFRPWGLLGIPE